MLINEWILSQVPGFLAGAFVGAAGTYLADRFTDQRRKQESRRESKKRFKSVKVKLPVLFAELKADLANPEGSLVRDFVVLKSDGIAYSSNRPEFRYYESVHNNLLAQLAILENCGYISNCTDTNVPRFRMTEQFVELLQRYG